MREIRFRAWNRIVGRMSEPFGIDHDHSQTAWQNIDIMQSTGLTDMNGVAIFEGDILEFDRSEWGGDDNIFPVWYDQEGGEWITGGGTNQECREYKKVIGNIYENQELIKAT